MKEDRKRRMRSELFEIVEIMKKTTLLYFVGFAAFLFIKVATGLKRSLKVSGSVFLVSFLERREGEI
jgi:hypothetical protein